jgi:hypothetical protein
VTVEHAAYGIIADWPLDPEMQKPTRAFDVHDATLLIKSVQRLIRSSSGRTLYLIFDTLRVHHAKIVREWVAAHVEEIEIFYLPSNSPELNPDKYINYD